MEPVKVIGIGQNFDDITLKQYKIIQNADLLIGGEEQLKGFENLNIIKIAIKDNLPFIVETIVKEMNSKNIVVLASGDPLFYGIGSYLVNKIGKDNITIYTNVSSVAKAFSKINEPWQDAQLMSLHGRNSDDLSMLFSKHEKFCILTDDTKNPAWIAQKIIDRNEKKFVMCVLEKLGTIEEKISWFNDLAIVLKKKFSNPNIVILKKVNTAPDSNNIMQIYPGMEDNNFIYENGLITKSEVRSIVFSKLNFVSNNHIFWDLGAGSGAISVEASSIITKGKIFAVEKNIDRISTIKKNISAFNVPNIKVINTNLPEGLDKLPIPDRIFIGGGGENLEQILKQSIKKLCNNGIIVINTVLIQNLEPVISIMKEKGLNPKSISIQISKLKKMPYGDRFKALNPVWRQWKQ